jgi:hypothetical protein
MNDTPTVKQIVLRYLRQNNCEGLCNPDMECGCGIDDLMPCGPEIHESCRPAYYDPERKGWFLNKEPGYRIPFGEEPKESSIVVPNSSANKPTREELAALRAYTEEQMAGKRYRYRKSGKVYTVLNILLGKSVPCADWRLGVLYTPDDPTEFRRMLFCRYLEDFRQKFMELEPLQAERYNKLKIYDLDLREEYRRIFKEASEESPCKVWSTQPKSKTPFGRVEDDLETDIPGSTTPAGDL